MTGPGFERVDVLLPTSRRPHTLPHAVESVLGQSYPHLELHVVCDGCDGDTEARLATVGDPRVRVHRFPKGPGFGYVHRNEVLRRTSAPLVAYMTDDDLWFPDHLERGVGELGDPALGLVAFRSCHVRYPGRLDPHSFAFDWRGPGSARLRNWFMGSVNCVHRRWVFDRVGLWNAGLVRFGDREFYNRVRGSAVPSRYVDEITVLRFYALHWDQRYAAAPEVPQRRYLPLLRDASWRLRLRQSARPGPRPVAVRLRQWEDFLRFALRSGPKFARFWVQKLTMGAGGAP